MPTTILQYFSVPTYYLVAGGYQSKTEVVEFTSFNSTPIYGDLPTDELKGAVGAILGNVPIVCGGMSPIANTANFCLQYNNSKWFQSHGMIEMRAYPAVVQINITTLWILGGSYIVCERVQNKDLGVRVQMSYFPRIKHLEQTKIICCYFCCIHLL